MTTKHTLLLFVLAVVTLLFAPPTVEAVETHLLEAARESITSGELQRHVDVLADDTFEGREAGSRGGHAAGGYIKDYLENLGLQGGAEDGGYFQVFGEGYRNIIAIVPGHDEEVGDEVVLIGAHYDHVGYGTRRNSYGPTGYIHNGADDNASGTAAIMEVAEALADHGPQLQRTVVLAFWDGEEKGLLGSKHWAAHPTVPLEDVALAINMDMIGRYRENAGCDVLGSRSAPGLRQLVARQNGQLDLRLNFTWELKENSDHHSFFEREIPVVMFHTGLHDEYHRPYDDAHLINSDGLQTVSQLIFNVVVAAAEADREFEFRAAASNESEAGRRQFEEASPADAPRVGVYWSRDQQGDGLTLTRVTSDSPAWRAGIRGGDRILQFAGREIHDTGTFRRLTLATGGEVKAVIQRGSNEPTEVMLRMPAAMRLGVGWRENDGEPGAVTVVRVVPASPCADAGIQVGDRIYELNDEPFANADALNAAVQELADRAALLVERQGRLLRIEVPVASIDWAVSVAMVE